MSFLVLLDTRKTHIGLILRKSENLVAIGLHKLQQMKNGETDLSATRNSCRKLKTQHPRNRSTPMDWFTTTKNVYRPGTCINL